MMTSKPPEEGWQACSGVTHSSSRTSFSTSINKGLKPLVGSPGRVDGRGDKPLVGGEDGRGDKPLVGSTGRLDGREVRPLVGGVDGGVDGKAGR